MKLYAFTLLIVVKVSITSAQDSVVPWSMFHGCETHCGVYPSDERKNLSDIKWRFKTKGKIFGSPAIYNGYAFTGSEDGHLYCIDIASGKQRWKLPTGGAVHSTPALYDNVAYFGSFDGYYYAVDASEGKVLWKFQTGGEQWMGGINYWGLKPQGKYLNDPWDFFLSSPVIKKDGDKLTVYFGSSDGNVYAVDAGNGALRWKYPTGGIIHSSPASYNGTLYIGSWDANLYALDATTGTLKWKFETGTKTGMSGIQASPVVVDGVVYFGARDANVYAVDATSGKMIWKYDVQGSWVISTVAVKDNSVYLGTSDSYLLIALDAITGEEQFQFKANGYVYSSPVIAGNTVFFGDFAGTVFAVDIPSKGAHSTKFEVAGRKRNTSILDASGRMNFNALAKGKDLSFHENIVGVMDTLYSLGSILSSPVVQDGVLYVGSADGSLYAVYLK